MNSCNHKQTIRQFDAYTEKIKEYCKPRVKKMFCHFIICDKSLKLLSIFLAFLEFKFS